MNALSAVRDPVGSQDEVQPSQWQMLVPVDLSDSTPHVVHFACDVAREVDAVVQLLYVVQLNIAGEERGFPRGRLIAQLADEARRELAKLIEVFWRGDPVATLAIREGRPHEMIVNEARDARADMIIMDAHKPKGFWRLLQPDTLALVIRNAPCPVLAVPVRRKRESSQPACRQGRVRFFFDGLLNGRRFFRPTLHAMATG